MVSASAGAAAGAQNCAMARTARRDRLKRTCLLRNRKRGLCKSFCSIDDIGTLLVCSKMGWARLSPQCPSQPGYLKETAGDPAVTGVIFACLRNIQRPAILRFCKLVRTVTHWDWSKLCALSLCPSPPLYSSLDPAQWPVHNQRQCASAAAPARWRVVRTMELPPSPAPSTLPTAQPRCPTSLSTF